MNDELFDPPAGTPEPTKPNGASPEGAPDQGAEIAALREQVEASTKAQAELTTTLNGILAASQNMPQQVAPAATPEPEATPDATEALNDLASDPTGFIQKVAAGEYQKSVTDQIAPLANRLVETQHTQNVTAQQLRIEETYGVGTWAEVFEPALKPDLDSIRTTNMALLSSPESLDRLVSQVEGRNRATLNEKEATHNTANEEAVMAERREIASHIPPSGTLRRTPGGEGTLTEDGKLMFDEIDKATGTKADRSEFVKLHNTGNSLSDYLAAVGKGDSK